MRFRFSLTSLMAVVVLLALAAAAQPATTPTSIAQSFPTVELAYIDASSVIRIVDPVPAQGQTPFTWSSATSGWEDMAVLDANADGIHEIVAIGGQTARIWAPHTPAGTTAPAFFNQLPSGFRYNLVATGDVVPGDGGRHEIILQRSDTRDGVSGYSVQIYNGNAEGTQWSQVHDAFYGAPWLRIETGQFNGRAGDDIIMVRNGTTAQPDPRILVLSRTDAGTFTTYTESGYNFGWLDMAVGNTHINNGNLAEIVLTREGVLGTFPSILVFQYGGAQNIVDAPNGTYNAFPYFHSVALGDVTGSGDMEAFFIRDPIVDDRVSILGLNWGTDPFPAQWEQVLGRDLQAIVAGDIDGDGRAEVLVARSGSYFWYTDPASGLQRTADQPASFRKPVVIKLGNFDGDGLTPPRLAVDKASLNFQMLRDAANPPAQTFQVSNTGGSGSINYNITRQISGDWFTVTPSSGNTPGTHTVSINGAGLAPGAYNGTIVVTAAGAGVEDSPRQINVQLTVIPTGPILDVQPASISIDHNFGGVPPAAVPLQIRNVGDGGARSYSLTVTTQDGGNWLQTSKTSGQTNDVVQVTFDVRNLRPGAYQGNIRVTAGTIEGSPADVPVTIRVEATGMVVTPSSLLVVADVNLASPRLNVNIDQAVAGSGAIHWYAYAVPSGDWWAMQSAYAKGQLTAERHEHGFTFTAPDGAQHELSVLPWVILTPPNGITPGTLQITFDMSQIPIGDNRVTILIDGGPDTPNRFQGVDLRAVVNSGGSWLPLIFSP